MMGRVADFIRGLFCNECQSQLERVKKLEQSCQKQLMEVTEGYTMKLAEDAETITSLQLEVRSCEQSLESIKKECPQKNPMKDYWDERKPKADILYTGRPLPHSSANVDVDVKLFITPQDCTITNWVASTGVKVRNPEKCNADILRIYKIDRGEFKYAYDQQSFGFNEVWLFPYELNIKGSGDCEDNSHRIASRLIAAGVPSWRVRVVCGMTFGGIGHSTVYVLADDYSSWVHINSTTPLEYKNPVNGLSLLDTDDLLKLPKSNNSKDVMGIRDVWFSFNDYASWHVFETSGQDELMEEHLPMVRFQKSYD